MDQDGDLDIFIPGHVGNIDFLENRALLGANLPKYLDHAVRPFGLQIRKAKYAPLVRPSDINNDGGQAHLPLSS